MTYHIVSHIRNPECTQMIPAWTKTEFMLIASRQKLSQFMESPSLAINENAIEQVTSAKSLGVYVDQNINWDCHIENVSKKIACAIGAIKRIRHLTPLNVLVNVYNSLIQPHFYYCNVVWGNCNKGLSEKLQRLQNRAARILMSASYESNLDDLFRALGWRRLYYQRLEQKSILMYKTLHGMTPDYLRSRFVYRDNVFTYGICPLCTLTIFNPTSALTRGVRGHSPPRKFRISEHQKRYFTPFW